MAFKAFSKWAIERTQRLSVDGSISTSVLHTFGLLINTCNFKTLPRIASVECVGSLYQLKSITSQVSALHQWLKRDACSNRYERGEEQNREEGEIAQKKLGGGRNGGEK